MDLKIALVQYDIIWEDTQANLSYLSNVLKSISKDTDIVVLPEMFHSGFSMSPKGNAQVDGGEVLSWMKSMSDLNNVCIIGSVIVETNKGYVNRLYVVNGGKVSSYDKRHLFTMGDEHKHYLKGDERIVVEIKGWKLCPLICYDLRFPVWSRNIGEAYDVLLYVANWPASRGDVWDVLLKARAIENQSYVIGVNRIGCDKTITYDGRSQVVDAKGSELINMGANEGVAYVELKKDVLMKFRECFPVLRDGDEFHINN
ncbi:amidohydrolase [Carboxylicivirga marina]|uniref:Amidohydrolase n=1 Tax=Carboxylicivirga marina TaxID=2800988 RepID=A0ABS1HPN8_9BACT|nr:amidohydrolase [Carboxylicivirga marina]MBK3519551.1 amidohydrolase [Carboxylicivirga marina]